MSSLDLANKKIVVTGAASGIGAETAKQLKSHGVHVIGLDRNAPSSSDSIDEFIQVDLSDAASIDQAVKALPDNIDGLCNIAGLPPTAPAGLVLKVNVLGLQKLTLALVDKMNDGASIVNVASLAGVGWPEATEQIAKFQSQANFDNVSEVAGELEIEGPRSYFFSKELLVVWTMANRWTWRDRGIRMNCVSPGPVETPILKDFIETLGERAEEDMKIMDRPGRPTDIAPVVTFLCSSQSAWIRGTNIPCDGGMFAHVMTEMHGI